MTFCDLAVVVAGVGERGESFGAFLHLDFGHLVGVVVGVGVFVFGFGWGTSSRSGLSRGRRRSCGVFEPVGDAFPGARRCRRRG